MSIVKTDWNIFKAKFSDNPQWYFERFCYLLFCREHNRSLGIPRYKNQAGIEVQPIERNNNVIGMQAKFYDDKTLSVHKKDLIKMLDTIHEKYPEINKLFLYSNQEWGQGKDGKESQAEIDIKKRAYYYNIEIEWRLASFFESDFVVNDNKSYSSYFFSLANTEDIFEKVDILNKEYHRAFKPLMSGFIHRAEEKECIDYINQGENLIIHGKAGRGKSGITANIVNQLECENIPYLSIKLDKRIPEYNADKWSEYLGLPCNIAECIDYISKDTTGVLILDQLDALRWTQSHSRVALDICCEIIDKIKFLNYSRQNKISIVFVCRTYDLLNDNSIKTMFETSDEQDFSLWNKIQINELSEEDTQNIIGDGYKALNIKTKNVLNVLSNLSIWQEINKVARIDEINECTSTFKLIEKWWRSIKASGKSLGFEEKILEENKEVIVNTFEKSNKIEISKRRLKVDDSILEFFISQNFIVCTGAKISFTHQTILDYLFAQKMEERFLNGLSIEEVIGNNQTPNRRFQLQLLMEMLFEDDTQDFIEFGKQLIKSEKIRYSFKFIFYEILNQIDVFDNNVNQFIMQNYEDEVIINNVLLNNKVFIRLLMQKEVLDKWIKDNNKFKYVYTMLWNLSKEYNDTDIDFIEENLDLLCSEEYRINDLFLRDVSAESDRFFELRMRAYNKYPDKITSLDFDIDQTFISSPKRAIKLLKFILQNGIDSKECELEIREGLIDKCKPITIEEPLYIINELIDIAPVISDNLSKYSRYCHKHRLSGRNIERFVIELLKRATKTIVEKSPEIFFDIFKYYFGKGSCLHNEIILYALQYVSCEYSDKVISYIFSNFNSNAVEFTSSTDNQLTYAKEIIRKHSKYCQIKLFEEIEEFIFYYKSSNMLELARYRYNLRKSDGSMVTCNYHGDLQHELLTCLDPHRINRNTADYIKVLGRKFIYETSFNKNNSEDIHVVASLMQSEKMNNRQWVLLLSNSNISENRSIKLIEKDRYCISKTLSQLGSDFQERVLKEPQRFTKLFLKKYDNIRLEYIPYLLRGISLSEDTKMLKVSDLENIIHVCTTPYIEENYSCILDVISSNFEKEWSAKTIDIIINTALRKTEEFEAYEHINNKEDNINHILTRSLNHTKSKAIATLAKILTVQKSLFGDFKVIVNNNISDKDVAIRYAVFELLKEMYNIDKEYATQYIIKLFNEDVLTTGAYRADYLIYVMSKSKDMRPVILAMYSSGYEQLYKKAIQLIVELYLESGFFNDIIADVNNIEHHKKKIIIQTAIMYYNNIKYNSQCKEILELYKEESFDFEFSQLFSDGKIDLARDMQFLMSMKDVGKFTLKALREYLFQKALSVIDYRDIIIQFSEDYILKNSDSRDYGDGLSSLLFGLYDEVKDNNEYLEVSNKCLDLIDLMFEKNIGNTRSLSKQIMDR